MATRELWETWRDFTFGTTRSWRMRTPIGVLAFKTKKQATQARNIYEKQRAQRLAESPAAQDTQTAMAQYNELSVKIDEAIKALRAAKSAHSFRQSSDPKNWGYTGDLAWTIEQLERAVKFLGGR